MDNILRIIEKNGAFRAFVADTTGIVNEATKIHGLSPVAAAAMGRTLTAASIMGIDLKSEILNNTVSGILGIVKMQTKMWQILSHFW